MTSKTLETIVGPGRTIKADYTYTKIPSAPQPIEPIYQKIYSVLYKTYDCVKYLTEFMYNMVRRK